MVPKFILSALWSEWTNDNDFVTFREAYSNPPVEEVNGEIVLSGSIINHTKRKISAILNIALDNGFKHSPPHFLTFSSLSFARSCLHSLGLATTYWANTINNRSWWNCVECVRVWGLRQPTWPHGAALSRGCDGGGLPWPFQNNRLRYHQRP